MVPLLRECCAEVPTLEVLFERGQELLGECSVRLEGHHDVREVQVPVPAGSSALGAGETVLEGVYAKGKICSRRQVWKFGSLSCPGLRSWGG